MAWLKIDDRVRTHVKIVAAGPQAAWFWFCGICYCREHLTDGFIPTGMLASLCPGVSGAQAKRHARKLIEVGLWHEAPGGFTVHDFLDWNPSRAQIEADREWDRKRKELYADADLVRQIRERDQDRCRYCGVAVNWRDRRGPTGGQFDHVQPRGENSFENVVVSCRACNLRKNNRPPSEAGMTLLPAPHTSRGTSSRNSSVTSSGFSSGLSSVFSPELEPFTRVARARGLGSGSNEDLEGGLGETTPPPIVPQSRPLVARRDLSAFWEGASFNIPQKWADKALKASNGALTESQLLEFARYVHEKAVRERIDLTQVHFLGWLDAELRLWRETQASRASVEREIAETEARRASLRRGGR